MAAPSKGAKNLGQFREETDFAGSGADYHGETIGFLVWAVDDDNAADGFDQNRLVMVADQVCEFFRDGRAPCRFPGAGFRTILFGL
jgi:hypothetical protein